MGEIKKNVRDSIFVNVFRDKKYLVELYRSLHPEDIVSEDDLKIITIENILADDMYNDLGFMVKNRLIVLVEAQTTWSRNIIVRMFLYLARTYQDLIYGDKSLRMSLYGSKRMELPEPELYVIYAGDKGDKKEIISLRDDIFPDSDIIDLKAKVIFADKNRRDIIGQYIAFCVILKEQISMHKGDIQKAVRDTIRICIKTNNLSAYLKRHEKEVEDYMFATLSQEEIIQDMVDNAKNEGIAEGRAEERAEATVEFAKKLLARQYPHEEIASITGLSVREVSNLAKKA